MIVDWLLDLVQGLLLGVLDLLPDINIDTTAAAAWAQSIVSMTSRINGYFPLETLAWCVGVILTVRTIGVSWRMVLFIYKIFPFKAT